MKLIVILIVLFLVLLLVEYASAEAPWPRDDVEFTSSQCRVLRQMKVDTREICGDRRAAANSRRSNSQSSRGGEGDASADAGEGGPGSSVSRPSGGSGGAGPGGSGSAGSGGGGSPGDPGQPGSGFGRPDPFPPSKPPPNLPGKPQFPGRGQGKPPDPDTLRVLIQQALKGNIGNVNLPNQRPGGKNAR